MKSKNTCNKYFKNILKIFFYFLFFIFWNAKHGVKKILNYAKRYFFLFFNGWSWCKLKHLLCFFWLFYSFIFYFRPWCKFVGKQIKTFLSSSFFTDLSNTCEKKKHHTHIPSWFNLHNHPIINHILTITSR